MLAKIWFRIPWSDLSSEKPGILLGLNRLDLAHEASLASSVTFFAIISSISFWRPKLKCKLQWGSKTGKNQTVPSRRISSRLPHRRRTRVKKWKPGITAERSTDLSAFLNIFFIETKFSRQLPTWLGSSSYSNQISFLVPRFSCRRELFVGDIHRLIQNR